MNSLVSLAWRESRTARRGLLLASSAITLGVAALVAIDSFAANIQRSVRDQSRALLGGDITISARRQLSAVADTLLDSLARGGNVVARETSFPSMAVVTRSGATRLVQVRAVSDEYPAYGVITTSPSGRWSEFRRGANTLVAPSLLTALDARIGDTLSIGFGRFLITGTVTDVPGTPGIVEILGPRVFIPMRYVAETQLLVFGSTAQHEALVRLTRPQDAVRIARDVRARLRGEASVRTATQSEAAITDAIGRLGDFIGIVGMVALLLGGLGVGSGVHAFVARKIDTVAVLRCLGATSRQVLAMYVAQAAAMGVAGATLGALLGVAIQFTLPSALGDFLPVEVSVTAEPRAILLGLAVGAWVALVFALRPLLAVRQISPLQTLRREADASVLRMKWNDFPRIAVNAAVLASIAAIALARSTDVQTAAGVTVGTLVTLGALVAAGWLASAAARGMVRARWPYAVRQGLANLHRPANQTRAVVLALGFGSFLVTTVYLVQKNLLRRFDIAAASSGANIVFFDVQNDQVDGVVGAVGASGQQVLQVAPIVTMRVASINGRPASELLADTSRARRGRGWALRWEYRATYRDTLVGSEKIERGRWFATRRTGDTAEISLERDITRDLGLKLGDVVTWNVQGTEIPSRIVGTREVSWARFEPNFFVVFPAYALRDAPKQFVVLAKTDGPDATARLQRAIVALYPNVSSIDLSLIRRTIDTIVQRASLSVRFLAVFCVLMGVPVMLSAVAATRRDRIRDSVLLKTLGATRGVIARILTAEYAVLGVIGSASGVLLATAASWALTKWVFESEFVMAAGPAAIIAAMMVAMTLVVGLLAGREVFRRTPMDALRDVA